MGKVSSVACPGSTRTGLDVAEIRFLVVHSSQLAQQAATAYAAAQAKEAERVAEHIQRVEARGFACAADAEAAISDYEGRGQGRRGRTPRPGALMCSTIMWKPSAPKKRPRRGRPPKAEAPQVEVRYRLVVRPEALPSEDAWVDRPGHHTAVRVYGCRDAPGVSGTTYHGGTGLSLDQESAAISPVWLEKPNGLRPWPCSRSWGYSCMRSSNGRSACISATMSSTSLGIKAQRLRPQRPWSSPLAPVTLGQFAVGNITSRQVHGVQDHHLLVGEAVGIDPTWYLEWQQSKMHGRVPHPLERAPKD